MDPATRIARIQEMLVDQPDDPFLTFALAKEWEKQGEAGQALTLYLRLREKHSDYVGTYYHLGKLYEALGRAEEALPCYGEGMEVARSQGDRHALQELAAARLNLADPDEEE